MKSARDKGIALLVALGLGTAALPPCLAQSRRPQVKPKAGALNNLVTFSTVGKGVPTLSAGQEKEIFRRDNCRGCLTHMWFAMDERTRVKIYVDGEATASIDMALDLGHGYGLGGSPMPFGSPKMGRYGGQFNTYRVPFGRSIRITVTPLPSLAHDLTVPEAGKRADARAWWIIRGTENLPVVIAGVRLPASARLKLYTHEPVRGKDGGDHVAKFEEFSLCDIPKGSGVLYQVTIAAQGQRRDPKTPGNGYGDLAYMEGMVRAYLNGSRTPTMLSSGLEDYFLGSGYFHQNQLYYGAVAGLTALDKANNAFSAYRLHDDDPVFFQNGFRLTLRNGEPDTYFNDPTPTQYYTYTWIYQW